jgi:hypothetical protein
MEKIAVFVDDAEHARRLLEPLLAKGAGEVRWVVVGCAPRLTQRIGKWVAHGQREQWRTQWARKLRDQLEPLFGAASVQWQLARGPLDRQSAELRCRLGTDLRLLDARRPKLGVAMPPLDAPRKGAVPTRWATPVAVSSSLSVMLALTD